jgi:serine/threonine-protein kinase
VLAQAAPPVSVGSFGSYWVLTQIGHGRTADVFLAEPVNAKPARKVVIKRLRAELFEDPDIRATFAAQAELMVRLRHPNLVETLETKVEGEQRIVVVEHLNGQPLSRIRERPGAVTPVPLPIHLRVLADVLSALQYLHDTAESEAPEGIVHGDVRPEKIFVTYDGEVKLMHSGIAAAANEAGTGTMKERLAYVAPEFARGEAVDRRSDIFSVGVMLWEAITGLRFWQDWHELAIYRRLCSDNLPLQPQWVPFASRELFDIAKRALAVNPDERYATAADMQRAIDEVLAQPVNEVSRGDIRAYMDTTFREPREAFESLVDDAPTVLHVVEPEETLALPDALLTEEPVAQTTSSPPSGWEKPVRAREQPPRALLLVLGVISAFAGAALLGKVFAQGAGAPDVPVRPSSCTTSSTVVCLPETAASNHASIAFTPPAASSPTPTATTTANESAKPAAVKPARPRRKPQEDPWGI